MNVWLRAIRVHLLPVVVAPVLVGTAAGWRQSGGLDVAAFALALLGAMLAQAAANMSNDHFDHLSQADVRNSGASAFSGGSRVIPEGLLTARAVLAASVVCLGAAGLVGVYLAWRVRSFLLLGVGAAGLFLAWFYTATPLRLGYRGLGELACGLCFGPLVVIGSSLVQSGRIATASVLASVPVGLLVAAVLLVNEFPDQAADRSVGKRTLVVLAGERGAFAIWVAGMGLALVWVPVWALAGGFPPAALLCLAALPFAALAVARARANLRGGLWSPAANRATLVAHLVFSTALAVGLMAGEVLG